MTSPTAAADAASPFLIRCSSCGAPAEFDVRNHIYKCAHCGASTDAKAPLGDLDKWRRTARENRDASLKVHPAAVCTCPSCGASMAVNEGEMSGTCPFCGATMARRSAGSDEQIPEVVIPFVLTPEDAQQRLDRWLALHRKDRCARRVYESRGRLEAVFLPYRLVKGPMICSVRREGAARTFTCGAFVNGSAINASRELPNDVLDAMEPYDWSQARAFDWGYLSGGQKARFPDVTEEELKKRTTDELSDACRPMVEKALMTVGVQVDAKMDEALDMPALLPVYVLRDEFGLQAFVNGQTGRVAVSDGSVDVRSNRWWLPPLILSILTIWMTAAFNAAAHTFAIYGGSFGMELLKAATQGMLTGKSLSILFSQTLSWLILPFFVLPVLFFIFLRNRAKSSAKHITSTPLCRAILTGDSGNRLAFIEGKEGVIHQDTAEVRPVFFEREVYSKSKRLTLAEKSRTPADLQVENFWTSQHLFPARIRFFPPRRIVRWTIQTCITALLPAIVSGIGVLFGAVVFTPTLLWTIGFWLIFIASWPLMSATKRIGVHVFDNPAIQRIHPDGSLSWVEKGKDESIFLGVTQIFTPCIKLASKSFNWAMDTSLGTTIGFGVFGFCLLPLIIALGGIPVLFCVAPIMRTSDSALEQSFGQGNDVDLMEAFFAMDQYLTQQEWNDLPQVDIQKMMFAAAQPLYVLSGRTVPENRREKIKIRLKKTLGEGNHLKLTDSAEKTLDSLDVKIPHSGTHTSKLFLAKPRSTANKKHVLFAISVIDMETKIPDDKLPLVTAYLNNFQRALPLGGFGCMGEGRDYFGFSMGLDVRGMKRIPMGWADLMTFWPLDVLETAETRVRDLIDGKTTDVMPDEKDVKELTDDFWQLSLWDGRAEEMRLKQDPGKYDVVPDLTPEQAIARFDAYLAESPFDSFQKPTALTRTVVYPALKTNLGDAYTTVNIDASRPKTVLIRATVKLRTNEAGEQAIRRRLFKDNINAGGIYRTYFDPDEKVLVAERRLFLRLLKTPPEDMAKDAFIQALANMKSAVESALKKD